MRGQNTPAEATPGPCVLSDLVPETRGPLNGPVCTQRIRLPGASRRPCRAIHWTEKCASVVATSRISGGVDGL